MTANDFLRTGIGLRTPHYPDFRDSTPNVGWLEIHSENYFGKGGPHFKFLDEISRKYALSLHGVGLSLGSCDPLNVSHLQKLKQLIDRYCPIFVSEHLCWSSVAGHYFNDLLPVPLTEESFNMVVAHINQAQDYLQRQILIENISSYLEFVHSTIPESEFLSALAETTGCGILLDINNLYINSINHGWNIKEYLKKIPVSAVKEIHLAGFTTNYCAEGEILIDTHDQPIAKEVWELYEQVLQKIGLRSTLIEWDKDLPILTDLIAEADKANCILERLQNESCRIAK